MTQDLPRYSIIQYIVDTFTNWIITTLLFMSIAIIGLLVASITNVTLPDGWGLIIWVAGVTGFVTGLLIE